MKEYKIQISRYNGFTLIELLVVISIIGLLSTVVMTSLNGVRAKARDAKRVSEIEQIRQALELYYADNGHYPTPDASATYPNACWINSAYASWGHLRAELAPYFPSLPLDPVNTSGWPPWAASSYNYSYASICGGGCDGQWYVLVYRLEAGAGASPGVKRCDGTIWNTAAVGVMAVGDCKG